MARTGYVGKKALFCRKMARPERFELPTYGFVDHRSIQLSYGRAVLETLRNAKNCSKKSITHRIEVTATPRSLELNAGVMLL
jgi:hypothetical protein